MVRSGHAVTVVGDRVAAAKAARVIGGGHVIVVTGDHVAAARTARTIGDRRGVAVVSERAAAAVDGPPRQKGRQARGLVGHLGRPGRQQRPEAVALA